jgi:hypothetical protein
VPPASVGSCASRSQFVAALRAAGAQVEEAESIDQPFFAVPALRLVVNDEDVQVLEYATTAEAQQDAAQISPDGYSVGTSMVTWLATPHFFQCGTLIVLYVGGDQQMLDLLKGILGA